VTGDRPLDIERLIETFHRHDVRVVVIGGVAVQVHGHRRTTMDLDIIPGPEAENREHLAAALAELNARPRDAPQGTPSPSVEQLQIAAIVPPLLTDHGELHILNDVPGAAPFAELAERALALEIDGIELLICGLDDLISMKRASGRPVDLRDIAALTAS
jgi:predicted nucleotidyltransferase